jgi:hypothetical protein
MTKIDPATFKPGDIVHVRGKVAHCNYQKEYTEVEFADDTYALNSNEIVAHFPAIRSWSQIEGNLTECLKTQSPYAFEDTARAIIALLNEIDPKGDA